MTVDGGPVVKEGYIFERDVYFYVFYCLCFVDDISTYMLEEQLSEERDPHVDEEEDKKMADSREDYWRYVAEDDEYKSDINSLRWYVHTKEEE